MENNPNRRQYMRKIVTGNMIRINTAYVAGSLSKEVTHRLIMKELTILNGLLKNGQ